MTDKFSKKKRSEIMSRVKGKDTKLETEFRIELWKAGLRYRKNVTKMEGKPDLYFPNKKVVIFLDSCFWHGCREHCRMPNSNIKYWEKKIKRNIKRDKEVTEYYRNSEYKIIRIWEHELKENFKRTVKKAIYKINNN